MESMNTEQPRDYDYPIQDPVIRQKIAEIEIIKDLNLESDERTDEKALRHFFETIAGIKHSYAETRTRLGTYAVIQDHVARETPCVRRIKQRANSKHDNT